MKISSTWSLIVVALVGVAGASAIILSSEPELMVRGPYVPLPFIGLDGFVAANSGLPTRLTIPKIGVDSSFEYVGLTPLRAMAAPKDPDNVAWFRLGPKPGAPGSAVVAGHFGWKDGIPSVFDDLYTLESGDKIFVTDDMGSTTIFIVREVLTYGENDEASSVFYSSDGLAHLNLVTCEGIWSKVNKSYASRLVVFTDKLYE